MRTSFDALYKSAPQYGADKIIKAYLGISDEDVLPITIPHGVDFYHLRRDLDIDCHDPIYLAWREDIAERVSVVKKALRFPHPWLLAIHSCEPSKGEGTLFIAPPPSERDFQSLHDVIAAGKYPRPWGILIKERDVKKTDFEWWSALGYFTHSAGKITDSNFYKNLIEIFIRYEVIASPNMSSAVIFAVAMGKPAQAIPDVEISVVDSSDVENMTVIEGIEVEKIRAVWNKLLSADRAEAISQARELLGYRYLDTPERLREKYILLASSITMPVHLSPLKNGLLYQICIRLIGLGIPVQKLFPNPLWKLKEYLLKAFKMNRLTVIYGSDFSHYKILGSGNSFKFSKFFAFQAGASVKPGFSFRKLKSDFQHK